MMARATSLCPATSNGPSTWTRHLPENARHELRHNISGAVPARASVKLIMGYTLKHPPDQCQETVAGASLCRSKLDH